MEMVARATDHLSKQAMVVPEVLQLQRVFVTSDTITTILESNHVQRAHS